MEEDWRVFTAEKPRFGDYTSEYAGPPTAAPALHGRYAAVAPPTPSFDSVSAAAASAVTVTGLPPPRGCVGRSAAGVPTPPGRASCGRGSQTPNRNYGFFDVRYDRAWSRSA
jgi:hypothetical protein